VKRNGATEVYINVHRKKWHWSWSLRFINWE